MSDCGLSTALPAVDYFACLGLMRTLHIDAQALEALFHERQKQFHPDRFIGSSVLEQRAAAVFSANLNEAFQTLKHPEKRVRYWLMLHGVDVNERIQLPPERLMQHLDWREQLDRGFDVESDAFVQLKNKLNNEHQRVWQQLLSLCDLLSIKSSTQSTQAECAELLELKRQSLLTFHDFCFLNKCLNALPKS